MYTIRFILIVLVALTNGASVKSNSLCSAAVCGSCAKIVMMRAGSYRVIKTCQKVLNMNGCCNSRSIRAALHFWTQTLYTAYLNKLSIIKTLTLCSRKKLLQTSPNGPGSWFGKDLRSEVLAFITFLLCKVSFIVRTWLLQLVIYQHQQRTLILSTVQWLIPKIYFHWSLRKFESTCLT